MEPVPKNVRRLVCFDLDGTLVTNTNSVEYLCSLSHAPKRTLATIERGENRGQISWVMADHQRAELIAGLPVSEVEENFDEYVELIGGLHTVLRALKARGVITVLITAGPLEVAQVLQRRFAFDHCFGSAYETRNGRFTGRIETHLGSKGKLERLLEVCETHGIPLEDCAAIGDSASDTDLFMRVGTPIGVNCAEDIARYAHHTIRGNDLSLVLPLLF
jgi:phosphoserine phosphatase